MQSVDQSEKKFRVFAALNNVYYTEQSGREGPILAPAIVNGSAALLLNENNAEMRRRIRSDRTGQKREFDSIYVNIDCDC